MENIYMYVLSLIAAELKRNFGANFSIGRVRTESWIFEKVMKFAQQFSRPGKSMENGWRSWVFFFQSYNKCFRSEIYFVLFKHYSFKLTRMFVAYNEESFVPAFLRSLLITYLESGKRICFGKKSGIRLEFWIQTSVRILYWLLCHWHSSHWGIHKSDILLAVTQWLISFPQGGGGGGGGRCIKASQHFKPVVPSDDASVRSSSGSS